MRRAAAPLLLLLAAGCGDFAAGVDAYRDGRLEEAHAAFVRACDRAGDDAPDGLWYDRALTALRLGDLRDAARSVERATGPDAVFLRGNVAFARAERAAEQARSPLAEPFAYDVAIRHAEAARDAWIEAATGPDDQPAARRNVERAQRLLRRLRDEQAAREEERRRESDPRPEPRPDRPPPPDPERGTEEGEAEVEVTAGELDPAEVARLLDRLAEKESEKRAVRRARRAERDAGEERAW